MNVVDFGNRNPETFLGVRLLRNYFDIEISDNPDFIFYSVYGDEYKKYNCVRIFWSEEPISPNFNDCDYAIASDYICFEDRYFRLPVFAHDIDIGIQDRSNMYNIAWNERRFCNFIYSNERMGDGAILRKIFCEKVMQFRKVDCPGAVLNNMNNEEISDRYSSNWSKSKVEFLKKYKFTIAFENFSINGYTTEKLTQPLKAGSIPIYYGNPRVVEEFNPKAFINCNDFDNDINRVLEYIKILDRDNERCLAMLMESPMRENFNFNWKSDLTHFLVNIVEKGNRPFHKYSEFENLQCRNITHNLNVQTLGLGVVEQLKRFSKVAIFGDGIFGNQICEIIIANKICDLDCILVSQLHDSSKRIKGIPVKEVDEVGISDYLVLVAIRMEAQEQVIRDLRSRGCNNILSIDPSIINAVKIYCGVKSEYV